MRGKTLTLVLGSCGALILGGVALACRDRISTAYYLYRLERDPSVVGAYLDGEQSSSIARAMARFSRTSEGKRALLGVFISTAVELDQNVGEWLSNVAENDQVTIWASEDEKLWCVSLHFTPPEHDFGSVRAGGFGTSAGEFYRRLRNAQEYLGDAGARSVALAPFPDLAFSFRAPGSSLLFHDVKPSYVCVATKAD